MPDQQQSPSAQPTPPMPPPATTPSTLDYIRAWGESPFSPTLLATLIAPLHMRPFQPTPMLFPPVLLFTSYLNLADSPRYKRDAAGLSATWSGLYILLAARRKQKSWRKKASLRGVVRGGAMGVGLANMVGGGMVYMLGLRGERGERDDKGEEKEV